jgi:hypothetical protein
MKIYISDKARKNLQGMINTDTPGSISIMKYNPKNPKHTISHVINKIKLDEARRVKHKSGKAYGYYVSKERLKEFKDAIEKNSNHEGGFLPFLPLIFGGLAAAGALAGGAAGIAKSVQDKQAADAAAEETKRHNLEVEQIARGSGIAVESIKPMEQAIIMSTKGTGLKEFINNLNLEDDVKGTVRNIFKGLKEVFTVERKGDGLYLYAK